MEFRQAGLTYILRIDKGEELVETLKQFCADQNITLGSISGIGAVNKATVGLFETATKQYHSTELTGDFEIASLTGNATTMNGKPYLHLHIVLADRDHNTRGGHLNAATVSATAEIIIHTAPAAIDRKFSEEIGLNLLDF
jgi:predicted DNA-binding protein with PD1-like motif